MKYLITSALPYINGIKHLGNLVGSILPADVYARYLRQQGNEVLYICGTDEHGTPAEIAAHNAGKPIDEYCRDMYATQKQIYQQFDIAFDYFGRSSAPSNHQLTQDIFLELDKNGYIEEKTIEQVYCIDDERFLPDRYVTGTCPHCHFEAARGDQCDGCGQLLDATDLINPRSSISGSTNLEVRQSKHLFLKLSLLEEKVRQWVATRQDWSAVSSGIAKKWLNAGLQDRCITRDLSWGVPIPKPGYEGKVFYVWFDAPNGYISATQDWAQDTQEDKNAWYDWWKKPEEIKYLQFMAKDNVPFHAVFWPAILLGSGENWKLVDVIKGFNWLNYEGGKFSTSHKRGIFTDQAIELYPADYWRYYLLAIAPESDDSDFTFANFASIINKDLADTLGNFISRVLSLTAKYFDAQVPESNAQSATFEALNNQAQIYLQAFIKHFQQIKFRQAMQQLRALWALGNEYITSCEPWKVIKTDPKAGAQILRNCLHLIRTYAIISSAIMPNSAAKIFELLGETDNPNQTNLENALDFNSLPPGRQLASQAKLFEKIPAEVVDELHQRFAGNVGSV